MSKRGKVRRRQRLHKMELTWILYLETKDWRHPTPINDLAGFNILFCECDTLSLNWRDSYFIVFVFLIYRTYIFIRHHTLFSLDANQRSDLKGNLFSFIVHTWKRITTLNSFIQLQQLFTYKSKTNLTEQQTKATVITISTQL